MKSRTCRNLVFQGSFGIILIGHANLLIGATTSWIGPATGTWSVSANWTAGIRPSLAHNAIIDAPSTVQQTTPSSADTLRLGAASALITDQFTIGHSLINDGYIRAGTSKTISFLDNATLLGSGSIDLSSNSTLTTSGTILTIGAGIAVVGGDGTIGSGTQSIVNLGRLSSKAGAYPFQRGLTVYGTQLANHGTLEAGVNSTLTIMGSLTTSQLGTLKSEGGLFYLRGTLVNDHQALTLNSGTGYMLLSGTIQGGVIQSGPGGGIAIPYSAHAGTLSGGATFTGQISIGQAAFLYLTDGILNGVGTVTLGPPPIEGPSSILSTTNSLTIGPGVTVSGGGNDFLGGYRGSGPGDSTRATYNQGTIYSNAHGVLSIRGSTIHNSGKFKIDSDAVLSSFGSVIFDPGGHLDIQLGSAPATAGLFVVNGALDLNTAGDVLDLSYALSQRPSGGTYTLVQASSIAGRFNQVTAPFGFQYTLFYTSTTISARVAPEPGRAIPLVAVGVGALLRLRRRAVTTSGVGRRQA